MIVQNNPLLREKQFKLPSLSFKRISLIGRRDFYGPSYFQLRGREQSAGTQVSAGHITNRCQQFLSKHFKANLQRQISQVKIGETHKRKQTQLSRNFVIYKKSPKANQMPYQKIDENLVPQYLHDACASLKKAAIAFMANYLQKDYSDFIKNSKKIIIEESKEIHQEADNF